MNTKYTKKDTSTINGLLDGTIENHKCNPMMNCGTCGGSGNCTSCGGSGETMCYACFGSGNCRTCNGSGQVRCSRCYGTGCTTYYSNGNQYRKICSSCNGSGVVNCPTCNSILGALIGGGAGNCTVCKGHRRLICSICGGSGNCTNCAGSGEVTCSRCNGSSWFQTYQTYQAKCYDMTSEYYSADLLVEGLKFASKTNIYTGTYKRWKTIRQIGTDNTETMRKKIDNSVENAVGSYDKLVNNHNDSLAAEGLNDIQYENWADVAKVNVTEIIYRLNDTDYKVYLLGDNNVVMYDEIPKKIKMYKPSLFKSISLFFTSKTKRQIAYIKLAAYIFQCDGKSREESTVLNAFVNQLKLDDKKKEMLINSLDSYGKDMPYELLRKEVKTLFDSKKTLTFVWQCMAVDKKISKNEEELFNTILAEYKNIDEAEVENIKRFASKYSLLDDENLVKEYMG